MYLREVSPNILCLSLLILCRSTSFSHSDTLAPTTFFLVLSRLDDLFHHIHQTIVPYKPLLGQTDRVDVSKEKKSYLTALLKGVDNEGASKDALTIEK